MSYNLTETQKDLMRWIVQQVRAGKLSEEFSVSWWRGARIRGFEGDLPATMTKGILDALAGAELLRCTLHIKKVERTSGKANPVRKTRKTEDWRRCILTGKAYEAVDNDFKPPQVDVDTRVTIGMSENVQPLDILNRRIEALKKQIALELDLEAKVVIQQRLGAAEAERAELEASQKGQSKMTAKTNRQRVLETIAELSTPPRKSYITDTEIAEKLQLTLQQIQDYLTVLEQQGLVTLAKTLRENGAMLTANGRLTVQDPDSLEADGDIHVHQTTTTGDTFNMTGNFSQAVINIKSTLTNTTQTITALPNAEPSVKVELEELIQQLSDALQQVPDDKAEDAEAVAQCAEQLVKVATAEKPNKPMIQITGDGLKQAAKNIAGVMPAVLAITTQIVATVAKLGA
jgi:predicted transcriptional regulator